VPVALCAGIASALRIPIGTAPSAVAAPAACAAARRKSRRLFDVMFAVYLPLIEGDDVPFNQKIRTPGFTARVTGRQLLTHNRVRHPEE